MKARIVRKIDNTIDVELAVGEDLRKSENDLKTALLSASSIQQKYEDAKKTLKNEVLKARSLSEKYKANSIDLGLDPNKNVIYKTVEAYLQNDLIKNLK